MNRQNDNFSWGARYEYAATLALSSIASAVQVPRPEDYGFDHMCTLTEKKDKNRYPRISFGVQVKPNDHKEIVYGDKDKDGKRQNWEVQWLFNRDLPLLIATVKLVPSFSIKLFSTWSVWHAYWMRPEYYERKVNILIDQQPELPNNGYDKWKSYPHNSTFIDSYEDCDVYLGHPICEMKSPNPNTEESKKLYECLNFWINLDALNIQFRKLSIPIMYTVQKWVTNEIPEFSPYQYFFKPTNFKRGNLLKVLAPMILSLENDFIEKNDIKNIHRLQGINEIVDENGFKLKLIQ